MMESIIQERIEALRISFDFYSMLFAVVGYEMYSPSFLLDEKGNVVQDENGRIVRLQRKPLFTNTNVVDITDPKSVMNYWAANYASANTLLEELELFGCQQSNAYYCDYNGRLVSFEDASLEDHRDILDRLTEAEQLMSRSRAVREMVQL